MDKDIYTTDKPTFALKTDIPKNVSELINDVPYLTKIPDEFITESELNNKGYATQSWVESQGYLTEVPGAGTFLTKQEALETYQLKGNYLTNADLSGYATQTWVKEQNYLTNSNLNGYATQTWVENKHYLTSADTQNYLTSSDITQIQEEINFLTGTQNHSSLSSIPTNKRLVTIRTNSSGTMSLSGTLKQGRELHILINNTSSSDINVTFPSGSNFISVTPSPLTIKGNAWGEVNIVCDVNNMLYVRGA